MRWGNAERRPRRNAGYLRIIEKTELSSRLFEFFQGLGHIAQPLIDQSEHGAGFEFSLTVFLSGGHSGEEFDALFDLGHWPDVKFARRHGLQNIFAQH